jgi:hypothetical protein
VAKSKDVEKGKDVSDILPGFEQWPQYRSTAYIRAVQVDEDFVVTDDAGDEHSGLAGDYLVVGARGDVWVEDFHAFNSRFRPVTPNKA